MGFSQVSIWRLRREAISDSPMPNTFTYREQSAPPRRFSKKGITFSRKRGVHSRGGPGSMMTRHPSPSKAQAGAVPQSF